MIDWTQEFFPTSFKGVAFWVDRDRATSGRRLVVTPFAASNGYDVEDMGLLPPSFEVVGYCAGDSSVADMAALEAAASVGGPGLLMMAAQGPVLAHCFLTRRERARDRMGRIGFEARFVLAPLALAAQPPEYLAQLTFDAVGGLSAASGGFLNGLSL
jgi:hypothetical protein